MNCREVKEIMIDYQEVQLNQVVKGFVDDHLKICPDCSQSFQEIEQLFEKMRQYTPELPDQSTEASFLHLLEVEKLKAKRLKSTDLRVLGFKPSLIIQIAAAIALILIGFGVGNFNTKHAMNNKLAVLEQENFKMNKLVAFSLMENESASKRLQAVNYAQAIAEQDLEILQVLIEKMQNDKHVNVRLAAANALVQFADKALVVDALIGTLETEKNANMQIELIQILVSIQEKRAIPLMQDLLKKEEVPAYVKEQINSELEQIG